jgi:hypothetical protein
VIGLSVLLLMAGAPHVTPVPTIRIDPCIEVDADEVRRLTAIELSGWRPPGSSEALEVIVACARGVQELRLIDSARGEVRVRSIDLQTRAAREAQDSAAEDRDAKARELALAIAELFRRTEVEAAPSVSGSPAQQPAVRARSETPESSGKPAPWRVELATAGVAVHWTGGETLFGADFSGRLRLTRRFIAELRLGARRTEPIDITSGSVDGHGAAAAVGLALDVTPGMQWAGVSLGARLGVDWLRYAALDQRDTSFAGTDAAAANLGAAATGFLMLSDLWCVTADASFGGALHSIVIDQNRRRISGVHGVYLSGALAVGGHF